MLLLVVLCQAHGLCCAQSGSFNSAQKGILKLGLSSGSRDGYIYVPSQYDPTKANAMILAIHAAGRGGLDALQLLIASANSSGETLEVLLVIGTYMLASPSSNITISFCEGKLDCAALNRQYMRKQDQAKGDCCGCRHHTAGPGLPGSHLG